MSRDFTIRVARTRVHLTLDHTSMLRMIEWRWQLEPLTVRDAGATNLADVLQFHAPDLGAKPLAVPTGPFGQLWFPASAMPPTMSGCRCWRWQPTSVGRWALVSRCRKSEHIPVGRSTAVPHPTSTARMPNEGICQLRVQGTVDGPAPRVR